MTEQAPRKQPEFIPPDLNKEQAEIEELERQLRSRQFEVKQNTELGVYDNTPSNEHEMHAREYFAQRPAVGIVRDGKNSKGETVFRRTKVAGGVYRNTASAEAYDAQNGTAQSYYDQFGGFNDPQPELAPEDEQQAPEKPRDYDAMSIAALAVEAGKAVLDDKAKEFEIIRTAAEDKLAAQALENEDAGNASDAKIAARHSGDNAEYQFVEGLKSFDGMVNTYVTRKSGVQNPSTNPSTPSESSATPEPAPSDKKVWIAHENPRHIDSPPIELVENMKVTSVPIESAVPVAAAETPGTDLVPISLVETKTLPIEEVQSGEKKEKLRDKVKGWWGKNKEKFGITHFGQRWGSRLNTAYVYAVNEGTEGLNEDEADKVREKNRRHILIGAAIVGAGVGALLHAGIMDAIGASDTIPNPSPSPDAWPEWDVPEIIVPTEGVESLVGNPAFEVDPGGGGLELFGELNLSTDVWGANAETLLSNFPNDFYRMSDGNVGLAHPGWLSTEAQEFIDTLK